MPMLTREPVPLTGLDELVSAARLEAEAARSVYAGLSVKMRSNGRMRLADILAQLAAEEAELHDLVPAPVNAHAKVSAHPHLAVEELDVASVELGDEYAILAMAVRNADRAFARWSYTAAHASDPDVRAGAEQLARAHLILASGRRLRRRAAFRAGAKAHESKSAPLTLARLEAHLSGLLACHEIVGSPTFDPQLGEVAAQSRQAARELERHPQAPIRRLSPEALGDPAVLAEAIVEGYFDAMNAAPDDAALQRLQTGAAQAVRRLELLRRMRPERPTWNG